MKIKQLKVLCKTNIDYDVEEDVLDILIDHLDGQKLTEKKLKKLNKSSLLKSRSYRILNRYLVIKPDQLKISNIKGYEVIFSSWTSSANNTKLINHLLDNQLKKEKEKILVHLQNKNIKSGDILIDFPTTKNYFKSIKNKIDKNTTFYKTLDFLISEIDHYNENEVVLKGNGINSNTLITAYKIPSNTVVKRLNSFPLKRF